MITELHPRNHVNGHAFRLNGFRVLSLQACERHTLAMEVNDKSQAVIEAKHSQVKPMPAMEWLKLENRMLLALTVMWEAEVKRQQEQPTNNL